VPPFGAPYAPSERELPSLIGPYRVLRAIARGSTSDVVVAREAGPFGFERTVVLKVLLPELRDDAESSRAMAREAAAYARLSHPAVARIHNFVSMAGEVALSLEYVDGMPLNELRGELHARGEELGDEAALFLGSRLFGALAAAHAARDPATGEFAPVTHADVNPSNLVVPWDGFAKLVDFGSARISGVSGVQVLPARPTDRVYLAPEQARGGEATPRSDVYSACLILWELLTRRRAVERGRHTSRELLDAMAKPDLPSLSALRPDLPKTLRDVVTRGLERDPDRRDVMAEDVCAVLRVVGDAWRGRAALAEALGALRLATLHRDPLETTPSLPQSEPSVEIALSPEPYVVHRSERPVVLTPPPPPLPVLPLPSRAPPPRWIALPVSLAVACCAAVLFVHGQPTHAARRDMPVETTRAAAAPLRSPARPTVTLLAPPPPATIPAAVAIPVLARTASADEPEEIDAAAAWLPDASGAGTALAAAAEGLRFGTVTVPPARAGHRVWIDGRLVGESPGRFRVSCGPHAVRVGSHGALRSVDVACGEDVGVR
jgi:serine/threonine-protein kinase